MESDLFEWAGWNLVTDTILQFYGCILKVPIYPFNSGEMVPIIRLNFETGALQLYDKGHVSCSDVSLISEHKVRLTLVS